MPERDEKQKAVYEFVTIWWDGLGLEYEGVRLGECQEYSMTQLVNMRVLAELNKGQ